MAKYGTINLTLNKQGEIVNFDDLINDEKEFLNKGNVIYIYRKANTKKVYVGQTKHFLKRNIEHFASKEEKFNVGAFNQVIVLYSQLFNGSALDDVERQLITYFTADRNQEIGSEDITNRTNGNSVNEYENRTKIASEVVLPFWEKELYNGNWVSIKTLDEIRTSELVKYSPIKTLTEQQEELINDILQNTTENYVINGDAGTGKTVLLTNLVARFLDDFPDKKIAVVEPTNWVGTAKKIFKVYSVGSEDNINVTTSTSLSNQYLNNEMLDKYDVVIVDEAHKLSRKYGMQHPSFMSVYRDAFEDYNNHLAILKTLANQMILMYDELQAVRPANITRQQFKEETKNFRWERLKTQFRIKASSGETYTSDDYVNGIKYLLYKDTGLLSETNYDAGFNRDVFKDSRSDAYFGFYEEHPLANLYDWINSDRNFHSEHVNRVLSGLCEPWLQSDGKNPNITHFHEGKLRKRWNSKQENWINSKDADAKEQVGSMFAVQGIDLNKVGVLIGPDLSVTSDGKLIGNRDELKNRNSQFTIEDYGKEGTQSEFTILVLNMYYVLMTRGIDGIRLGFWKNDDFKEYFKKTFDIE